jgi:transposase-like protein
MLSSFFHTCREEIWYWWVKLAGMNGCKFCGRVCQKAGKQTNGKQRVYCKSCKKYQQETYRYQACKSGTMSMVAKLISESVSIRGISRVLKISKTSVIRKILAIAGAISKPLIPLNRSSLRLMRLEPILETKLVNTGSPMRFAVKPKR